MDDAERPRIRHRGDLLRVLNNYIDQRIKIPLGKRLAEEGKIQVDRAAARERFFRSRGDEGEQLRRIWQMEVPEDGQVTPLMKTYNLTPQAMLAQKDMIEVQTDKIVEQMLGEQAVAYLAGQALKQGALDVDPQRLERQYELKKDELTKPEWMSFRAIRFPTSDPDAREKAAQLRNRIEGGEISFEQAVDEYLADSPDQVIESEIENNPASTRFKGFWIQASGAEPGDILGPVYLPRYNQVVPDGQGGYEQSLQPDSYVVMKVLEHRPERPMTLEEAAPSIAPELMIAQKMEDLREEYGVEIYRDKLPEPGHITDQYGDPLGAL